jgi:AraC-like DNA-binding protein
MSMQTVRQIEPAAHLRPWISDIRVGVSSLGQTYRRTRLPGGEAVLLFRATDEGTGELTASGPLRHARYKIGRTNPFFVRVSIRPGRARQVLGYPLYELADRVFPLEDLWNSFGRTLCSQLMEEGPDRAAALVEEALSKVIASQDPKPSLIVSQIVQAMDKNTYAAVDDYADLAGLSPRHLRRLFQLELGIGPKRYLRIARIRRLLATARANVPWATLAIGAGFYDQAHLIADFKELLNATPDSFLAARTEYKSCR